MNDYLLTIFIVVIIGAVVNLCIDVSDLRDEVDTLNEWNELQESNKNERRNL